MPREEQPRTRDELIAWTAGWLVKHWDDPDATMMVEIKRGSVTWRSNLENTAKQSEALTGEIILEPE